MCKSLEENERQETLFTPLNLSTEEISPGLFYKYLKFKENSN